MIETLSYRDEGTLCHALVEMALREGQPCASYIGRIITIAPSKHFVLSPSSARRWMNCPGSIALSATLPRDAQESPTVGEITADMACAAQVCVDWANAQSGEKFFEQQLPIHPITREENATGMVDCVIVNGSTLTVADWKFGYGAVEAENNPQLALYALGGIEAYELLEPFETFRFVIVQPAVSKEPNVWECTRQQLENFKSLALQSAERARACFERGINEAEDLSPGEGQCKWCKATGICPALATVPQTAIDVEFTDLTAEEKIKDAAATVAKSPHLARYYELVPLIEQWIDAVNTAMHTSVGNGDQPDYKLVAGKKGARAWADKDQAEALMKSMRLKHDEMYDYSIISPTKAENVLAESPRRWGKLKPLIVQKDGKPTIAKATDKRPALIVQFEALTGAEDLV